jgi:hypothetical protein
MDHKKGVAGTLSGDVTPLGNVSADVSIMV